jgi:hypothetical protein
LTDLLAGVLDLPERVQERIRFIEHSRACTGCRAVMIDHAHTQETVPLLRSLARAYGMEEAELAREVVDTVRRAILNGQPERVFTCLDLDNFSSQVHSQTHISAMANVSGDIPCAETVGEAEPRIQSIDAIEETASVHDSEPFGERQAAHDSQN